MGTGQKCCFKSMHVFKKKLSSHDEAVNNGFTKDSENNSVSVAYPGILFGGGGSTNSVEDRGQREQGSGGSSPLVRGSGGSCNLVQEISFHIVKFS